MLSLWRQKTRSATAAAKDRLARLPWWNSQRQVGKLATAASEPMDEMRNVANSAIQTATQTSAGRGARARPAPSEVATPLPPWPLRKIGEDLPQHRDQPSSRWQPIEIEELSRHHHRKRALARVDQEHQGSPAPAERAADIGGADVAAAYLAQIHALGARHHDAGRERAEQEGADQKQNVHGLRL